MTLVLAFLIRLVLMSITLHGDLLFTNYFPYFLSTKGVWDIYGYFGDHYLKLYGYTYYAPLNYYLVGGAQWLLKGFAYGFGGFMEHIHAILYRGAGGNLGEYLASFSEPDIRRWIFWMKFPYLIADALCLFVIAKIYAGNAVRRKALILWCFHPILLFSVYVFGTYRIYPAFVMLCVVYWVRQGNKTLASLALGTLCLMDNFPWLLLPSSVLILGVTWRERLKLFCLMMIAFSLLFIPLYVHSHGYVRYAYLSPIFARFAVRSLTRQFAPMVAAAAKSLFVIIYGGVIYFLWSRKRKASESAKDTAGLFVRVNAAVLLLFYATSQTPAHYFMWVLPLFVMMQAEGEPWRPWLSWVLIGLLLLFNLDSRQLNLGLFLPVLPDAFSYPSLHEILAQWVPWGKVVASARLIFSGISLYFVWRIINSGDDVLLRFRRGIG